MGDIQLKLKKITGKTMTVTLFNVRYVPTFIGNLFSISTTMSNGAEIRFRNKKMEVQKEDVIFEFLPTNTDNCGFLFSIDAERKNGNYEKAFMAKKVNENNIINQNKNKKVTFDENVIIHTCEKEKDTETETETEKPIKNQKKKRL